MVSRLSRGIIHRKNTLFLSLPRMIDTRLHREKGWTLFQKFITTSDMNPIGNEDTSIFVLKFLGKGILLSLHVTWRKIRKSRVSFPNFLFFFFKLSRIRDVGEKYEAQASPWRYTYATLYRLLGSCARQ